MTDREFEWCTDCTEYDMEHHCCHRWSQVIRRTVEELQIIRCKDCKHYAPQYNEEGNYVCNCQYMEIAEPNGYCHMAERKEE